MYKESFEKYKSKRLELIYKLENNEIDKNQFLEEVYKIFDGLKLIEPDVINNIDEALYFYQYFNIRAKQTVIKLKELDKCSMAYKNLSSSKDEYYEAKEEVLFKFVKLLNLEDFEAYFVSSNSKILKNRLIEINVVSEEKVILHSLSTKLLRYLRTMGKIDDEIRVSKIDDYINTKY